MCDKKWMFYTLEQSLNYYILRKKGEDTAKWMGRMGLKIGIDIFSENGGDILFQIFNENGLKFEKELIKNENGLFGIYFDNYCLNPPDNRSDFPLYYDIIEPSDNSKLELIEKLMLAIYSYMLEKLTVIQYGYGI